MPLTSNKAPDVLVLGGGGILGEAWMMGVLAGIEAASGADMRRARSFVGTSAGSIVAAALAGGIRPQERLAGGMPEVPPVAEPEARVRAAAVAGGVLGLGRGAVSATLGAVAPLALRTTAPGGALARRVALGRFPRGRRSLAGLGRQVERTGARWDGRLRIATLDLASGRRVMFGAPGAPAASLGQAIEASCAIPGVFRPVAIGGREYVDGGAWSPTNMDAAPVERGARVLCLIPTGARRSSPAPALRALGELSRSIARIEALALERRGARVVRIAPDDASTAAIGPNLMDARPRQRVAAAAFAQGRALGLRPG